MAGVSRSVRAVWVAGLVSLLLVIGAPPAGGAFRGHGCRPPARARVLASSRRAVLFSPGGDRFYGCLRALGVTRLLLRADPTFKTLIAVRLAGRFAALEPAYSYKAIEEDVMLYDLRSGKARQLAYAEWDTPVDTSVIEGLDFLALDSSGFVAWRKTSRPQPNRLDVLSCPSTSLCVASDGAGNILTSSNPLGGAGAWSTTASDQFRGVSGVSCPSVSMCVAADTNGNILTSTDPTGGASAWTKTQVSASSGLGAVSCPSVSLCVAVDYDRNLFTSTDPTGGASAWKRARIAGWGTSLSAVSCPSVSLCLAVDDDGNLFTSTDPTGGKQAWKKTELDTTGYNRLEAVSCPSISLCVAGDWSGNIWTSTDPTGGKGAWKKARIVGFGGSLGAVSCPSISTCVVGDYSGNILTSTDPTGGRRAWKKARAVPGAPFDGLGVVSCPSVSLCVAGDRYGDILTSTNPTGGAHAWSSASLDVPGCPLPSTPCISERLLVRDDQGTRVVDTTPAGHGNSIGNVALASRVLNWTHDGTRRQLQLR